VPALAAAAAKCADPDATLARGLDLIEAIARRAAYLALLAEHPEALERVSKIIAVSSWAAQFVTRHPLLLDELLDDRVLYAAPDWRAFEQALRAALAGVAGDEERQMNVLREQHQAQVFRLLAQDLAGLLTVEKLADHLSELADRVLGVTLELCWAQLRTRHREAPRFAVVAYGKLGGKELGYASDLDLIFLYDDTDERAAENYARLAQRLNHWLTTRTSSGALFETDLRLRPGRPACWCLSAAFAQEESAWVGAPGAHARALLCRRRAVARIRSPACILRRAAQRSKEVLTCASACTRRTPTPRACSTSSTTAAA
jgi:glutamate-ammonia-ligase adenylyltransferase